LSTAFPRIVILISLAHALVHVYELALPNAEQLIAQEFADQIVGRFESEKAAMGALATCFRLPFGALALLAGWLSDRVGSKRMLAGYLLGCGALSLAAAATPTLSLLFPIMFLMGSLASVYHPAGLAMISRETTAVNRTSALGWHGILGSAGIGGAPFLAGLVLNLGSWRDYYALLALPGALLGLWFCFRLRDDRHDLAAARHRSVTDPVADDLARPGLFILITVFGTLAGFIYAGFITFLPRYLDSVDLASWQLAEASKRSYLAGGVLILGMLGQYISGRLARPDKLEWFLVLITAANAPLLAWMALATGTGRVWAAGSFALVHFMHQPLYNSAIAGYVPHAKRSTGYGLSFLMTFGVGSFGAYFAGITPSEKTTYLALAGVALVAAAVATVLAVSVHLSKPGHGS